MIDNGKSSTANLRGLDKSGLPAKPAGSRLCWYKILNQGEFQAAPDLTAAPYAQQHTTPLMEFNLRTLVGSSIDVTLKDH